MNSEYEPNEISRAAESVMKDARAARDVVEKAEARARKDAVERLSPYAAQADRIDEIAKEVRGFLRELVDEVRERRQEIEVSASSVARDAAEALPKLEVSDGFREAFGAMKTLGSRMSCVIGRPMPLGSEKLVGPDFRMTDLGFARALTMAAEPGDGLQRMEMAIGILGDMKEDLASLRSKKAKLGGRVQRFEGECRKAEREKLPRPETPPEVAVARKKLSELQKVLGSLSAKLQKVLELYYDSRKKVLARVAGLSETADAAFAEMEINTCAGIAKYDVSTHLNAIVDTDNAMARRQKAKTRKEMNGRR